ncbi:MAG: DsrE family protein [Pseudomonadota bacterium]|nr:DsrE family protein [Pseudomonadota bacterium]
MPDSSSVAASSLIIVLNDAATTTLAVALRYASTAAAMDVAVELHAVSGAVTLLREGAIDAALLAQLQQATALGVALYACPAALSDHNLVAHQLIADVAGVRGAASLLAAGLAPGARFMVF